MLGREPDAVGAAHWQVKIDAGLYNDQQLNDAFAVVAETELSGQTADPAPCTGGACGEYVNLFGRPPTAAETADYNNAISQGQSVESVRSNLANAAVAEVSNWSCDHILNPCPGGDGGGR